MIEQFLNVNTRTDGYGKTAEGRNRCALEVARAAFDGPFLAAGGFDQGSAEQALVDGKAARRRRGVSRGAGTPASRPRP